MELSTNNTPSKAKALLPALQQESHMGPAKRQVWLRSMLREWVQRTTLVSVRLVPPLAKLELDTVPHLLRLLTGPLCKGAVHF